MYPGIDNRRVRPATPAAWARQPRTAAGRRAARPARSAGHPRSCGQPPDSRSDAQASASVYAADTAAGAIPTAAAASSTAGDAEGWATGINFIAYDLAAMILLTHLFLVTEQRRKAFRRVPRPLKLLSAVCMLWLPVRITLNEYVNPRPPRSVNFLCNLFMYLYPNDR